MFCRNCGNEVQGFAVACMKCGCNPHTGKAFCPNCGAQVSENQIVCVKCGVGLKDQTERKTTRKNRKDSKNKTTAGLLALFLGTFGVHQFYLGNTTSGILRIVITVVGAFIFLLGPTVTSIFALIEGIKYLTMSDEDFDETYVQNKRGWF